MSEPGWVVKVLWRRWRLIAASMLVAMVVAGTVCLLLPRKYEAEATILVGRPMNYEVTNERPLDMHDLLVQAVDKYLSMSLESCRVQVKDPEVLAEAARSVGLQEPLEKLAKRVFAAVPKDSNLVKIRCEARTAAEAASLANAVVAAYVGKLNRAVVELTTDFLDGVSARAAEEEARLGDLGREYAEFLGQPNGVDQLHAGSMCAAVPCAGTHASLLPEGRRQAEPGGAAGSADWRGMGAGAGEGAGRGCGSGLGGGHGRSGVAMS